MYIKKFNYFINESVKILGNINTNIAILYEEVSKIYIKKLFGNDNINVTISLVKMKKNTIGHIILNEIINKKKFKIKINKDNGIIYNFGSIAHELTHVKQVYFNELGLSKDGMYIIWMGENYISVSEYNNIIKNNDIVKYKSLPWELEAYKNQKEMSNSVKNSGELEHLKNVNTTLSFIVNNLY